MDDGSDSFKPLRMSTSARPVTKSVNTMITYALGCPGDAQHEHVEVEHVTALVSGREHHINDRQYRCMDPGVHCVSLIGKRDPPPAPNNGADRYSKWYPGCRDIAKLQAFGFTLQSDVRVPRWANCSGSV